MHALLPPLLVVLTGGALFFTGACGSLPDVVPCGVIPEGGCPAARGGTCDDPSCAALYHCIAGAWNEVEACSHSVGQGGAHGSRGGAAGAGGCTRVEIDQSGQTINCQPDLQPPDCSVAIAETCQPCDTGCLDFFLCTAEGHQAVAYCDDDGVLNLYP